MIKLKIWHDFYSKIEKIFTQLKNIFKINDYFYLHFCLYHLNKKKVYSSLITSD